MGTQNTLAASVQPKKGRLYAVIQVKKTAKQKQFGAPSVCPKAQENPRSTKHSGRW